MSEAPRVHRPQQAPALGRALAVLIQSEAIVEARNARAWFFAAGLPLFILLAFFFSNNGRALGGAEFRVSLAIVSGMAPLAFIGYAGRVSVDRHIGIYRRLRVTPAPGWTIVVSRLLVQLAAMLVTALLVIAVANVLLGMTLTLRTWGFAVFASIASAAMFLAIAQLLVSLLHTPELVNAGGRLVAFVVFALGVFGQSGMFGEPLMTIARVSPGGIAIELLRGALGGAPVAPDAVSYVLAAAYTVAPTSLGIYWFRWDD
jgi:ABC-2 type transport system permease protein